MTIVRRRADFGIPLAPGGAVAPTIWVSDREPGLRLLYGELVPEAEVLDPDTLAARLAAGAMPEALVIDGTQLLELPARRRSALLRLPRLLVCTGLALTSIPMHLVSGPGVTVLAKPFRFEDLEAALSWLREGAATASEPPSVPAIRRRRPRTPTGGRPV